MSASTSTAKLAKKRGSAIGAPSQRSQPTRKGKKAWRKNVDLEEVEETLEDLRAEERITGSAIQDKSNDDLFVVDTVADEPTRKAVTKTKGLQTTAAKILAQRSAVPAVFSRTASDGKRKSSLTKEEKEKLLRIAKRPRKGPLNSYIDPTEFGAGSAVMGLTEAVRLSGGYDPWNTQADTEPQILPMGTEHLRPKTFTAPVYTKASDLVQVPAVVEPHLGTSYNPPVTAHQELLLKAHEAEEKRVQELEKLADFKRRMEEAHQQEGADDGGVPGMWVDVQTQDSEVTEETDAPLSHSKSMADRKTKQQRRKAAKLLVEKRLHAHKLANKRMLASISDAKALRKEMRRTASQRASERDQRKQLLAAKLRRGLSGQKLGKHKVPEGEIAVQLGEDLSETLRAMKPEGNMFRDRFISLQQRGRLEPRALVLPKKRRRGEVEYEKHAWKNFDRE